jgi:hypothetical protein
VESEEIVLLRQIAEGQRRIQEQFDHALAGPPGDKGPRKGWLREMIASINHLAHPLYISHPGFPFSASGEEGR